MILTFNNGNEQVVKKSHFELESREEPGKGGADCLRCECGSLLARYVTGGVELKCRRCKRTVVIPIAAPRPDESTA